MGLFSNRIERSELRPADHVYSWRRAYTYAHHGIYIGNNKVVHFTRGDGQELGSGNFLDEFVSSSMPNPICGTCPDCGFKRENSGVILSCLDCFLHGGPLYRFEYGVSQATFLAKPRGGTCTLAESDAPDIVLHRVMYLLRKGFGNYDIFTNNCEDFAIYCKTGLLVLDNTSLGRSGQAASFIGIGIPVATVLSSPLRFFMAGSLITAAAAAGLYSLSRYATDIGIRTDKYKVAVEDLHENLGWATIEENTLPDNPSSEVHETGNMAPNSNPSEVHETGNVAPNSNPSEVHETGNVAPKSNPSEVHETGNVAPNSNSSEVHETGNMSPNSNSSGSQTSHMAPNNNSSENQETSNIAPNNNPSDGQATTKMIENCLEDNALKKH